MALSSTDRGSGNHNTGATSFGLSPASNPTAGAWLVLVVAYDNSGASGADPFSAVTDSAGNTWTSRQRALYDPGAASAGTTLAIVTTDQAVATLTTGSTITVSFGANSTTAKAWALFEVTAAAGQAPSFVTSAAGTGSATGTPTITTSSLASGDMVVGGGASESSDTWAGDADTSNGSWSTHQHAAAGSGTTGQSVTSQRKVVTATATQTYNPTHTSADTILAWISLREVTAPVTGTSDGTVAALTGAASAEQVLSGTSAGAAPALTGDAAATQTLTGTGGGTVPALTGDGAGDVGAGEVTGAGAATLPGLTGAASGTLALGAAGPRGDRDADARRDGRRDPRRVDRQRRGRAGPGRDGRRDGARVDRGRGRHRRRHVGHRDRGGHGPAVDRRGQRLRAPRRRHGRPRAVAGRHAGAAADDGRHADAGAATGGPAVTTPLYVGQTDVRVLRLSGGPELADLTGATIAVTMRPVHARGAPVPFAAATLDPTAKTVTLTFDPVALAPGRWEVRVELHMPSGASYVYPTGSASVLLPVNWSGS